MVWADRRRRARNEPKLAGCGLFGCFECIVAALVPRNAIRSRLSLVRAKPLLQFVNDFVALRDLCGVLLDPVLQHFALIFDLLRLLDQLGVRPAGKRDLLLEFFGQLRHGFNLLLKLLVDL